MKPEITKHYTGMRNKRIESYTASLCGWDATAATREEAIAQLEADLERAAHMLKTLRIWRWNEHTLICWPTVEGYRYKILDPGEAAVASKCHSGVAMLDGGENAMLLDFAQQSCDIEANDPPGFLPSSYHREFVNWVAWQRMYRCARRYELDDGVAAGIAGYGPGIAYSVPKARLLLRGRTVCVSATQLEELEKLWFGGRLTTGFLAGESKQLVAWLEPHRPALRQYSLESGQLVAVVDSDSVTFEGGEVGGSDAS